MYDLGELSSEHRIWLSVKLGAKTAKKNQSSYSDLVCNFTTVVTKQVSVKRVQVVVPQ